MFVILGATGHIGGAAARALLDAGERVMAVTSDARHAADLATRGAVVAEVDVHDAGGLRDVFSTGRRALLVNPPADPASDTDAEELATGAAIIAALDDSGLEAVVTASTYGAQPGEALGDLSTLFAFEQRLAAQPIPTRIHRGAYYYSNWAAMLDAAKTGTIRTPFRADLELPMVDPADLGREAAARLRDADFRPGFAHLEGPRRYTIAQVAAILGDALGRHVAIDTIEPAGWEAMYADLGFSPAAARAYARMAETVLAERALPDPTVRCPTTLEDYVAGLVA